MKSKNKTIRNIKKLYRSIRNRLNGLPSEGFDLDGEKYPDWGWCGGVLTSIRNKEILDVGCAYSPISLMAIANGNMVWGIDVTKVNYSHPDFHFIYSDFLDYDFGKQKFDLIIMCSTVEHIGLQGRYMQNEVESGDILAMNKSKSLLKEGGNLIITIPVGLDLVFKPWHRIYGVKTMPGLFNGFKIVKENYWVKSENGWGYGSKEEALNVDKKGLSYALGQFYLCVDR